MKQEPLNSPHEVILGRIYVSDESRSRLPLNPGLVAYYPDAWLELWLKLGKPTIVDSTLLEECIADSTDETV